jgi:hypothetical protein
MTAFGVRPANKHEIKDIAAGFLQDSNKDSRFANLGRNPWQRFIYGRWVLPRYLHGQANTFILEQDGRSAGFAVVEQAGEAVTLSEFTVQDGYDTDGLLRALARTIEELARDREYRYARVALLDASEALLALFRSAGYELVDYYLWSFTGELAGGELAGEVVLESISAKEGLEQRVAILRQELDASPTPLRAMIESTLFPRRPSPFPSWRVAVRDGAGEAQTAGYLSLRPNERKDSVLSIALSLHPDWWGAPLEAQAVAGAVFMQGKGQPVPVRVMISTSAHADRAAEGLAGLGLQRVLDDRPILAKDVQGQPAANQGL